MNTAEDGLPLPLRYWAILNLAVGMALSVLDSAIANIALPAIAKEIHASAANSIWVINAYQLAVVISLLPFASLGDIFGYRRIYMIGLAVFSRSKIFGLAFTVIVSAGLCLSDWRFAEFYKLEAAKLAQSRSTASSVWVSGHWGWQWYATQNGFRQIDVRSPGLRPGDYYVVVDDDQPLKAPPPMRLVRTDTQDGPLLNLFCTGRSARFYASTYMAAPWSLSRECLRHVTVFQIEGK